MTAQLRKLHEKLLFMRNSGLELIDNCLCPWQWWMCVFQENSPKPGLEREGGVVASVQKWVVSSDTHTHTQFGRHRLFGRHTVPPPPILRSAERSRIGLQRESTHTRTQTHKQHGSSLNLHREYWLLPIRGNTKHAIIFFSFPLFLINEPLKEIMNILG